MTEQTHSSLMRRKARSQNKGLVENPLTSSRAVRLALTKAANDTVGLAITVSGIAEEVTTLDDALGSLANELMLLELWRDGDLTGLIAMDMQLRAAVLEMQTIGALIGAVAEDRPATRADKILCESLINTFLVAFPTSVVGTPFEGWGDHLTLGDKLDDTRAAGLVLRDRDYRVVRMSVDIGMADRQGQMVMVLPLISTPAVEASRPAPVTDWHADFEEAVLDAPACLDALLHRFSIPLATANALQVGSLLPLTGCSVNSVRLLSADGRVVAQAKLGQTGGKRAVRPEAAPLPELQEFPNVTGQIDIAPAPAGTSTYTKEEDLLADTGLDAAPMIDVMGATPELNEALRSAG